MYDMRIYFLKEGQPAAQVRQPAAQGRQPAVQGTFVRPVGVRKPVIIDVSTKFICFIFIFNIYIWLIES